MDVWRENASSRTSTISIGDACYSIFIDTNNSLYCSLTNSHKVIKQSLNTNNTQVTTVIGTDCPGYQQHTLFFPSGVFVSISFDLYVADSRNQRVQLFKPFQVNGITVAGIGAPETVQLLNPTAVMLDADGYIFILDSDKSQIIRSGSIGFRCVIGCSNPDGSASNQLYRPQSMAFDSYGNVFVSDTGNNRLQQFIVSSNSCSKRNT